MTSDKEKDVTKKRSPGTKPGPGWAKGLRDFYDSVVEEPLPDSFSDLLSQLDDKKT